MQEKRVQYNLKYRKYWRKGSFLRNEGKQGNKEETEIKSVESWPQRVVCQPKQK